MIGRDRHLFHARRRAYSERCPPRCRIPSRESRRSVRPGPREGERIAARPSPGPMGGALDDGSTPTRRALLLGLASVPALPALAAKELKGSPVTATNAYIAIMDGRDAIQSAMELQGMEEEGRRTAEPPPQVRRRRPS